MLHNAYTYTLTLQLSHHTQQIAKCSACRLLVHASSVYTTLAHCQEVFNYSTKSDESTKTKTDYKSSSVAKHNPYRSHSKQSILIQREPTVTQC